MRALPKAAVLGALSIAVGATVGVGMSYLPSIGAVRRWALRTLADGQPVMMNVTVEEGSVCLDGRGKWAYLLNNTFTRSPRAVRFAHPFDHGLVP